MRKGRSALLFLPLAAVLLTACTTDTSSERVNPSHIGRASSRLDDGPLTTLSFVAHPDDDLLFMNPDILSDVQAGYNVWVVIMTAGEVGALWDCAEKAPVDPVEYANARVEGSKAAYARAAQVDNPNWISSTENYAGHPIITDTLEGTNVHLLYMYIHAASGADNDDCGDLYRMLHDPDFVSYPLDGGPAYTQSELQGALTAILDSVNPDYMRSQSTLGHRDPAPHADHIDHTSAALFVANADSTAGVGSDPLQATGAVTYQRDEYRDYSIIDSPDRFSGYWRDEKFDVWQTYKQYDPMFSAQYGCNTAGWDNVMGKESDPAGEGRRFVVDGTWEPPGDFNHLCSAESY